MGAPEVTLGRLHGDLAEEELDLLQFAAGSATEPSATPPKIVRASWLTPIFAANSLPTCQSSFSVTASPQTLPVLLTRPEKAACVNSGSSLPLRSIGHTPIPEPELFKRWRVRGGEVRRRALGQAAHDLVSP